MSNLIHNERVKYTATLLNNMAVASFTAGLVLPALSAYRPSSSLTSADYLTLGVGFFTGTVIFIFESRHLGQSEGMTGSIQFDPNCR
jgi:hypothetical protein